MNGGGYWDPLPAVRTSAGTPVPGARPGTIQVLPEPETYLLGSWPERSWQSVPGPLYGGGTDTCWTGRLVAPAHILYDDESGEEFVYRQPRAPEQVRAVLFAALNDPFGGYGWDGDQHWTPESVRSWWRDRGRLREWAAKVSVAWAEHEQPDHREMVTGLPDFLGYLDGELACDLRTYLFWLQERRSPRQEEALPQL